MWLYAFGYSETVPVGMVFLSARVTNASGQNMNAVPYSPLHNRQQTKIKS